jgi:hypothetical protein
MPRSCSAAICLNRSSKPAIRTAAASSAPTAAIRPRAIVNALKGEVMVWLRLSRLQTVASGKSSVAIPCGPSSQLRQKARGDSASSHIVLA